MVLGLDDAVGGAALAGDVTEDDGQFHLSLLRHSCRRIDDSGCTYRSTSSPLSFSILAVC